MTTRLSQQARRFGLLIIAGPLVAGCGAEPPIYSYGGPYYAPPPSQRGPGFAPGYLLPAPPTEALAPPASPSWQPPISEAPPLRDTPADRQRPPEISPPIATPAPQPAAVPTPHTPPPDTQAGGEQPPTIDATPPGSRCGWWRLCNLWE